MNLEYDKLMMRVTVHTRNYIQPAHVVFILFFNN